MFTNDLSNLFVNINELNLLIFKLYLFIKRILKFYSNEEMLDLKKSKDGKGRRRRLRKKYQLSESENDDSSQQKDFTKAIAAVEVLDSEIEDTLPISSLCRGKHASNGGKVNVEEKARKETANLNDNETEDNATMLEGINAAIGVQPEW